jgi:hypothetical protein
MWAETKQRLKVARCRGCIGSSSGSSDIFRRVQGETLFRSWNFGMPKLTTLALAKLESIGRDNYLFHNAHAMAAICNTELGP